MSSSRKRLGVSQRKIRKLDLRVQPLSSDIQQNDPSIIADLLFSAKKNEIIKIILFLSSPVLQIENLPFIFRELGTEIKLSQDGRICSFLVQKKNVPRIILERCVYQHEIVKL